MTANPIPRLAGMLLLLSAATAAAQSASPKALATYGPNLSYYRVGFNEFVPADSGLTFSDAFLVANTFSRYPTSDSVAPFVAVPHLPSGALVTAVEFDWCDTNDGNDATFNVSSTASTGENVSPLATTSSTGSTGCASSVAELSTPFAVDNNSTQLVLTAVVPATDGTISISGAIVRYQLQVSPAPATATFNDVPTSHPFFQYIEALAASGITGGCLASPPMYCPDAPLTRGQMAVFLAKGLGLSFP